MGSPVEFPVYDRLVRRLAVVMVPVFFLPIVTVFAILSGPAAGGPIPNDLVVMLIVLTVTTTGLSLMTQVTTGVFVRIDPDEGRISRLYKLFGRTVYRRDRDLSQFDGVSLHRGGRGGYRTTLVGRDNEVVLRLSSDLKEARKAAEAAVACCGLKLNDRL